MTTPLQQAQAKSAQRWLNLAITYRKESFRPNTHPELKRAARDVMRDCAFTWRSRRKALAA
jgi:hypothetical protein